MSSILELTDGTSLEQFVITLSAKNVKTPAAVVPIIKQALSAPSVFVFGELLAMENVKQLQNAEEEHKRHFELLEIFAYGTFADYKAKQDKLPQLSQPQNKKLKQLSIVSLASKHRVIPYEDLLKQLDIPNVRELEDLIIDCIYQGLLEGKLDQQKSQLEVDMAIGRDLRVDEYENLQSTLSNWCEQSSVLLDSIKEKITWAKNYQDKQKLHKAEFDKKIESIKANIKAVMEADMMDAAHYDGGADYFGGDEPAHRPHKGRKGHKPKGPKDRHRGRNM